MVKSHLNKPKKKKKRVSNLTKKTKYVDYKDKNALSEFVNRQGRIVHRTYTQLTAKSQRQIAKSIKRARQMALLPYTIVEQNEEGIQK